MFLPYSHQPTTAQLINKRPGRQVGAKGRVTESIRWGIVEAYRQLGGVDGLVKWGKENPSLFYPMLTKLLPAELAHSARAGKITVVINTNPTPAEPRQISSDEPLDISSHDA